MPRAPGQGGFTHSLIGNLASLRASLTYVTGAHNMKFGYQGGFGNPSQTYQNFTQVVQVRTMNGVPNQLTQTLSVGPDTKYIRNLIPTNLYAQDQWTRNRLTLQGGVRYDSLISNYPDQGIGGPGWPYAPEEIFFPSRSTPGYEWKDLTPRVGVAYDLFGNGKTAVRFNLGKYLEAITASNNDLDMNPLIRTATNSTRGWTDADRDFVPDCDLNNPAAERRMLARWTTRTWGRPCSPEPSTPTTLAAGAAGRTTGRWACRCSTKWCRASRRPSPTIATGGATGTSWTTGRPTSRTTRRSASTAPLDPRLPGGGGQTISGLYNLVPTKVGQVDELAQSYENFGDQTENWQGVDVSVWRGCGMGSRCRGARAPGAGSRTAARVRAKLPELGSNDTGLATNSSVTANVNALGGGPFALSVRNPYCRIAEPYRTDFRGLASYTGPESGRPAVRDVGEHPRRLPAGGLHRDQCVDCRRAAAARPAAHRGRHRLGEPDPAGHAVGRAAQQHRPAHREDSPVRDDADAGGGRHLQPAERRHGHELQLRVRAGWLVADSDDHCAGAVRQNQRAGRLLMGETGPPWYQGRAGPAGPFAFGARYGR